MVEINNLAFSYGSTAVLENITMDFREGHIYGLLGENGVGKTTLLTLLSGLKKPKYGNILIDGKEPFHREPSLLQNILFLQDEPMPYGGTALSFAKYYGAFRPNFDLSKFIAIMTEFETDHLQRMNRMSAGQLKKTYISFALACGVKYLFMDEPTNGLDIPSKAQFRSALMKYTADDSVVVISTHQVRDLENIIDPIVILDKQDVLLNASIEKISEKLFFDYGTVLHPEALYSEQLPGGFIQVLPGDGTESKVNIEALFNAVHKNKYYIKELFAK